MAAIADLERLLERVFERTSARVFRARIQPVQVERRLERTMERGRTGRGPWPSVPSRFRVRLHPADLDDVAARTSGPEGLAERLAQGALAFARGHGYRLAARPFVLVVADPAVERGRIEVDVLADVGLEGPTVEAPPADVPAEAVEPDPEPIPALLPMPGPVVPACEWEHREPPPVAPPAPPNAGGIRADGMETRVFRRPAPAAARAVLRVTERDGRERVVEVDGSPLTVGRATDNALVIADGRVSRHHGRLQARRGMLVYTDLGSTNGSRVNGIRVDEIVLGPGDRLMLGDVMLVVESLPG